jgi:hypothetical protein
LERGRDGAWACAIGSSRCPWLGGVLHSRGSIAVDAAARDARLGVQMVGAGWLWQTSRRR